MDKNEHQHEDIYRPLIDSTDRHKGLKYPTNNTFQISIVPHSHIPHSVIDQGSADPRVFRSSFLLLPMTSLTLQSTGMPLGGILCPLFQPITSTIYDNSKWRCRCGTYYSPSSYVKNDRLFCDMCRISKHEVGVVDEALLKKGVVDLVISEEGRTIYYVFLFEVTRKTLESEVLETMLEAIKAASLALPGQNARFAFIGHTAVEVRYYRLDQQTKQLEVILNRQFSEMPCSLAELSCSVEDCQVFASQLVENMDDMGYLFTQPKCDQLTTLLTLLVKSSSKQIKKIIVLSNKGEHEGEFGTGQSKKDKTSQLFGSQNSKFKDICSLLTKQGSNTSLDLFCFPEQNTNLQDLKSPYLLSGGSVNVYDSLTDNLSQLYYDTFRVLTRVTAFKVSLCFRASPGICLRGIGLNHTIKIRNTIQINSLNEDQTLSVFFAMDEYSFVILRKFMPNKPSIQFAMTFETSRAKYKRIINFCMFKVRDSHQVMAGFDPEAGVRLLATQILHEKHIARQLKGCRKKLTDSIAKFKEFYLLMKDKLIEEYSAQQEKDKNRASRKDLTARYDQSYGLFLSQIFYLINRTRLFEMTSAVYPWEITNEEYVLLTNRIEFTSKIMYPRVYELFIEDLREKRPFIDIAETIPAELNAMEKGNIYLFDKGYKLFIVINEESQQFLLEMFGTADFNEIQALNALDGQSEINLALSQFVEQIREQNKNGCQPLQLLIGQRFYKFEQQLLVENSYYSDCSDSYEAFMREHSSET